MSDEINTITGTSVSETLVGTSQNDFIKTNGGSDIVYGFGGDDNINARFSNPSDPNSKAYTYWYSAEPLLIFGGDGNDLVSGGQDSDVIYGGSGNDRLYGQELDDKIYGEAGNDYIVGHSGDDTLTGGTGDDELYGNDGNDTLTGGIGDDKLYGYDGNDTLDGGTGFDYLWGGDGDDTYIINSTTFYLWDSGGNDTAIVNVDFARIPTEIENVTYAEGVKALPYWISALIFDSAARYSSLIGTTKNFNYSFPETFPTYRDDEEKNGISFETIGASSKENIVSTFDYLAGILNLTFTQVQNSDQLNNIAIWVADLEEGVGGRADGPWNDFEASDIKVDKNYKNIQEGEFSAHLFTHELGHALGLKHPFSAAGATGGVADPPYLDITEDKGEWTQMTYTETSADYYFEFRPLDIAALQYLYGPNPTSRAGDDTYTYSSNDANFIWDGAGTDTIDASSATEKVTIYLEPGYWGFGGDAKADTIISDGQITVNFGTVVENLTGSNYDDKLVGNTANNDLSGGYGNDTLYGGDGTDKFDKGSKYGDDTFYGGKGNDQYYFTASYDGGSDTIVEYENEGLDVVYTAASFSLEDIANVEALYSYSNVTIDLSLTGNSLDNLINPSDGNCVIDGKEGVDRVIYSFDEWSRADCSIFKISGVLKVLKGNGSTDTLINCEKISFSDQTVIISELQLDLIVTEFSPSDDATEVAVASDITLTFGEAVKVGTGDIVLKKSDGTVIATYDVATSSNLSISDKTLTINPDSDLSTDTTYEIVFDIGAIVDLNGNQYTQVSNYQFTTIDTIDPTISSFSPNDDATEVAVASDIAVTFSEAIKLGSGYIHLKPVVPGQVIGALPLSGSQLSISGNILTISPGYELDTDKTYEVTFQDGAIVDLNDNKYTQGSDYQFTTIDTIDPTITSFSPADDATGIGVASDITVTFSEAIKRGTGDITLKTSDGTVVATYDAASSTNLSISDKTLTVNPSENIETDTTYQLVFDEGAIVDINDNKHKQSGDYQFTTIETIKPTLLSINKANLFDEGEQEDIVLTFSESIKAGTGSVIFKNTNTGVITDYKVASATNISIEASTLTIVPPADLDSNSVYTVELDSNAVTDLAGNKYDGLTIRYGSKGDDIISGEGGDNFISGGSGTDTVTFTNDGGDYLVSKEPETGRVYLTDKLGEELGYVLDDVEKLNFRDLEVDTSTLNYWGNKSAIDPQSESPVYRFYNTRDKAFFYTDNADEKALVITSSSVEKNNIDEWPYVYQGSTFEAAHSYLDSSALVPVFRFYNYETGHHFFTVSEAESEMIKGKIASGEWPFDYEGTRFNMYSSDPNPNSVGDELAVHRFYSPSLNRHFFTGDTDEANAMILTGVWNYEGVGFYGEILG